MTEQSGSRKVRAGRKTLSHLARIIGPKFTTRPAPRIVAAANRFLSVGGRIT
jgi:hypothetical protein